MISLSMRMRPKKLDDFVGQEHFFYKGSLLYNAVKNKTFDNGIFFGPSGTGKTTLARIIAKEMDDDFVEINASSTGIKELKEILLTAKIKREGLENRQTYIYVDEVHRWNKLQQDSLLQALEEGHIKFIGSTTENPYFSINNAILSRVRNIFEFKKHETRDLKKIIEKALQDKTLGLGNIDAAWSEEAIDALIGISNGDGRVALDSIEYITLNRGDKKEIDLETVEEAMQKKLFFFSRQEDKYNLLSALQKSIRGSDPDASIYYLVRLIEGGEDIVSIGRRLLVMASEDIGMAYPQAITIVNSCVEAALKIGYPEAEINLAQAVILMATSPKSNASYMALKNAKEHLKKHGAFEPPNHIKDSHYKGAVDRGFIGYLYPHDFGGYVEQQYLPIDSKIANETFYFPTDNGSEASFKKYLKSIREGKKER